jgi:Helix-turn-helix.
MDIPNLKRYREELLPKVSQEAFAREAEMTFTSYRHIERGRPSSYKMATKIHTTLNRLRVKQGLEEVSFEDLKLNLA